MNGKQGFRWALTLLSGFGSVGLNSPVFSADTAAPELEEIVVTAQKRQQTLQEVPISVSVTGYDTIEKAQIRDLIDLQSVVPSLKVAQTNAVGQTNFYIRGFGNGAGNDGIESSVGVFVDGVYRSRTSSALDDLPDVERIEVLRGPQSTLFGKNVSAGAISIVTEKPKHELGGSAEVTFGNFNQKQVRASVNVPLGETFAFKISGTGNKRDGFEENIVTGHAVNNRDRWSARADLLWDPIDQVTVRVLADYNENTEVCCGTVQVFNGPVTQLIGGAFAGAGLPGLGVVTGPESRHNREIAFNTDPSNKLTGKGVSAQVDWRLGFATLTSITADRAQANADAQDVDFTGADLANKIQSDDIHTFTQEFRLASTSDGPLSWLVGGFYQNESLNTGESIIYGTQIRQFVDEQLAAANFPGVLGFLEGALGQPVGTTFFGAGQGIDDYYDMHQSSYSGFGQVDFKVTNQFTLTGGLAYLHDHKAATSHVVLTDKFAQLPLQTLAGGAFAGLGAVQNFYGNTLNHEPVNFPNANEDGLLDGHKFTYLGRAAYDFGPMNAYFSYSTGWKAGAYNLSSDSRPPDANGIGRTADPENSGVYELGVKTNFKGGFVNVAVFKESIKGFQSNAYTGLGYALVNAGEESVKGFEIDAAYHPINMLALTESVTYLDPKYDSFKHAPCFSFDTVNCPIVNGIMPPFRDLSGKTPAGTSRWSSSTSATLSQDLGYGYAAYLRAEFDYTSTANVGGDGVPSSVGDFDMHSVNASLGMTNTPYRFEVMVWARNLFNSNYIYAAFPTVAQTGSYSGFVNDPRTFGVTLRKKF